jgi:hypothetical protein
VRVNAAYTLERLLQQEQLKQHFSPNLKDILVQYLKLVNEFESDTLIDSLKGIFEIYSDEIGSYAVELCNSLMDLFFQIEEKEGAMDHTDDNAEALMDTGLAGQACMVAMQEILHSQKITQESLVQIFDSVEKVLYFCFGPAGENFLEEALPLLNMVIYKANPVTEKMWAMFPLLWFYQIGKVNFNTSVRLPSFSAEIATFYDKFMGLFGSEADSKAELDNMNIICVITRNYMNSGGLGFLTKSDIFGNNNLRLLCEGISKFIAKNTDEMQQDQNGAAFLIIGSIFTAFDNPSLDEFLPDLIKFCISTMMQFNQSALIKNVFYHNVCLALHYDPVKTLEILKSNGVLELFFSQLLTIFQTSITYRIRKAIALGMLSLFSLSPEFLGTLGWDMVNMSKVLLQYMPVIYEEHKEMIEGMFENFWGGDDDDFDGDFGSGGKTAVAVDKNKDPLLFQIVEAAKIVKKKNKRKSSEELEAVETLYALDDHMFKDGVDGFNEILLTETTLNNLKDRNPLLFDELLVNGGIPQGIREMADLVFKRAKMADIE